MNGHDYNHRPGRDRNDKNSAEWAGIIFLAVLGLWPISIIWAILKLSKPGGSQSKSRQAPPLQEDHSFRREKPSEKLGRALRNAFTALDNFRKRKFGPILLMILGFLISFTGLALFETAGDSLAAAATFSSVSELISSLLALGGGVWVFLRGLNSILAVKRYPQYAAIIGSKQAMHVGSLAKKTGHSEKLVLSDLQKLIDKGFFGSSAYINRELGYLFLSNEADEELSAAREAALEKAREASRKESARQEADIYEATLQKIRDVNDRIANPVVTEKIYRLEDITRKIFKAVQDDPSKVGKIDRFMSYYLPSTLKILDSYDRLEDANVPGENIAKGMRSIEDTMDSIIAGFERQLDDLYKMDTLDIESDLDVMQQMLARDKAEDPFKAGNTSAAAAMKKTK